MTRRVAVAILATFALGSAWGAYCEWLWLDAQPLVVVNIRCTFGDAGQLTNDVDISYQ